MTDYKLMFVLIQYYNTISSINGYAIDSRFTFIYV